MLDKKTKRKMDMCADIMLMIMLVVSFVGTVFILKASTIIDALYLLITTLFMVLFISLLGTIIGSSFDKEKRS